MTSKESGYQWRFPRGDFFGHCTVAAEVRSVVLLNVETPNEAGSLSSGRRATKTAADGKVAGELRTACLAACGGAHECSLFNLGGRDLRFSAVVRVFEVHLLRARLVSCLPLVVADRQPLPPHRRRLLGGSAGQVAVDGSEDIFGELEDVAVDIAGDVVGDEADGDPFPGVAVGDVAGE